MVRGHCSSEDAHGYHPHPDTPVTASFNAATISPYRPGTATVRRKLGLNTTIPTLKWRFAAGLTPVCNCSSLAARSDPGSYDGTA
ncbi:hypothetical protein KCP77_11680 [Salmonella enterica subsp. enterica]|nr:hypothetical protein KCP77_11680 [Salmonella enterica subsp. enterica]